MLRGLRLQHWTWTDDQFLGFIDLGWLWWRTKRWGGFRRHRISSHLKPYRLSCQASLFLGNLSIGKLGIQPKGASPSFPARSDPKKPTLITPEMAATSSTVWASTILLMLLSASVSSTQNLPSLSPGRISIATCKISEIPTSDGWRGSFLYSFRDFVSWALFRWRDCLNLISRVSNETKGKAWLSWVIAKRISIFQTKPLSNL